LTCLFFFFFFGSSFRFWLKNCLTVHVPTFH
jgi:hypothetical protein